MKFFLTALAIALLSFVLSLYTPWWVIAPVAFLVAMLVPLNPSASFMAGFTGIFVLWFILTLVISSANNNSLASRISLMVIKVNNPYVLMVLTAFLGALVAGFAALSGAWFRKVFLPGRN